MTTTTPVENPSPFTVLGFFNRLLKLRLIAPMLFVALFMAACLSLSAQTVLISPTGDGGFETGTTFAANGWNVAQGSLTTRVWQIGTGQTGYTGNRAAFIGNSATTVGTNTSVRTVHLYKSITIPVGATNISLSFKYKQATSDYDAGTYYDYVQVYLNGTAPTNGSNPSSGSIFGPFPSSNVTSFATQTVTIPNSYATGTATNLIFTFNSDDVTPTGYGAIDDVSLTYTAATPCSGTPAAGTASISPSSGLGSTAFTASVAGATTGSGISYQWQYTYDGTTWADYPSQTSTTLVGSATTTIQLRLKTTCSSSGLTNLSNVVTYTVTGWNMPTTGTVTATGCSGTFYDAGGVSGSYGNSQTSTITFYPGTAGAKVILTFTSFATENNYDGMMIYNGNSSAAPLISSGLGVGSDATTCPAGSWRGTGSPGTVTSTAADGSLTVIFRSDAATVAAGWAATLSCYTPCTTPTTYTVTGGGTRCSSDPALVVGLSGSQSGLSYQLKRDGSAVGSAMSGTGSALAFPTQTVAGTYTVEASGSGYCTTTFGSSVSITVNTSPTASPITGTTTLACGGTTTLTSALPTGGSITTVGGYNIHTFTSSGTFALPAGITSLTTDVLVVGGGGGGGNNGGGGGGGGGVLYTTGVAVTGSTTVTVGAGGANAVGSSAPGSNGANSVFGSLTAIGGGGGASRDGGNPGQAGGSGGGGGAATATPRNNPGAGTAGQGNAGGSGTAPDPGCAASGGGGGGAGAAGSAGVSGTAGKGGNGISNSITGSAVVYGGGGGGGITCIANGSNAAGGTGGGGSNGASGTPNTGGGGAGNGGGGGSGIVIVRYPAGVWSSSNTGVATVNQSGVVSGVSGGTATIYYTFTANGCSDIESAVVTVSACCTPPSVYTVTGGGTRCASGAGVAVGLSGSQSGISYQLYNGASAVGSAVAGTGSAITFGLQSAAGTYTVVSSAVGYCTTTMTGSVSITVDPVAVLGTLNNTGPVVTCDQAGNISQVTLSGYTGTPSWEYGDAAGNWYVWNITAANAGTCCFMPNPGADRMRVKVTSGTCGSSAYSSTILVQNKNAPAPTSLGASSTAYCLGARPTNISLTATFPTTGDILPTVAGYTTVKFYSGSCGGTYLGDGIISGNTATLSITSPTTTTSYFALATSSCETSTCATVTVTVTDVPTQPSVVTGPAAPCMGSTQSYSVTNISGVAYAWAFPGTGWTITGGTGTNAITVTTGSGSGNITVTPSNGCGNGTVRTFAVTTTAGPTVSVSPSSGSVCGGVGVSLTASGASSYTWSPSTGLSATTGATVTATPSANTTYTVTETSSGCANSTTVVVKVGNAVTASASAGAASVCPGSAVTLTASGTEGSPTLLSGTDEGGFEAATSSLAANGWSQVGTTTPSWYVGTAAGAQSGAKAAFIGSSSTTYSGTGSTIVNHIYKDIFIPAGYTNVYLNYYLKYPTVDNTYDYFYVYTTTTGNTPVANTVPSTGYTQRYVNTATTYSSFTAMPQVDLSALAGTTVRLVFTFRNDGSSPLANPAIDNISITGTPPSATYSYNWGSSPAGFSSTSQSTTANPTVATSYNVTVTNTTSGCSAIATTSTVNMLPVPQGSLTAGGVVCAGELASLTYTSTAGTGPFNINYNPSSQTATGVTSGTAFSSANPTASGTNTYTLLSVTSADGCVRNSGFTGATATVNGTSAPTVPTSITSSYNCTTGAVTLTVSPAPSAGEAYRWYTVASGGSPVFTGVNSITVTPSITTTYYAAKYYTSGGTCESPRLGATAWNDGLESYVPTRTTGITYSDIASSGTAVTSWRNGTSEDNLSNTQNIGFSFPYDGGFVNSFRVSSNGFLTFNTATNATGDYLSICGSGDAYSVENDNFAVAGKAGTLQAIAPFFDDLIPNGYSLNSSMHYLVSGSAPNRVLTVQWRGMSLYVDEDNCTSCSYGNYNFQAKLYETSGNIEFVYGTMTTGADEDPKTYVAGLNSASLSSPLNASKLYVQQSANSTSFGSTLQTLSTGPAPNSRITFTRGTIITPTEIPSCMSYNYPLNGATNQCANSTLSWNPANGNPTSYDVYFGTSSTPALVASNVVSMYYNPGTLAANTTYYWKIVPKNAIGTATATMPTWSFTTSGGNTVTGFTSSTGTVTGNTLSMCTGQSTTITITGSLSEGSYYEWRAPFIFDFGCGINPPYPLLGNCQANSRTFNNLSTGTYRYYVTATGCNGTSSCLTITIQVSDNANTAPTGISSSGGTTICAGTSTVLTPTGGTLGTGATYEWFAGSCGGTVIGTTSTLTVSPTSTTTYYVRRTGGTTCANTTSCASVTVTVQNAIANNSISSAQSICSGQTPSGLTGTTPTGGSGTYTYDWFSSTTSASAGYTSLGSNTINYSPGALSQTTWFKRVVTSGSCTAANESTPIQITVTPTVGTPSTITIAAGSEPSCQLTNGTTTTTYSTTAANNTGFNWSLSNGAAGNINASGVMTWANGFSGTVDIQVTANGCGGPTAQITRTVTINPSVTTPIFTAGTTTLCAGATETYTATLSNGTVSYSVTGGASINASTGVVTGVTSSFVVTATGTGCNGPTTATRSVTVTPSVGTPVFTAGATTLCSGATETYTATVSNGTVSYSVTGGASINASTGTVTGVTSSFVVTATGTGCNGPTTVTRSVTVTPSVSTPIFTTGTTTLCSGTTDTYTATVSNGTVSYSVTGGASINASTGAVSNVTSNFVVTATGMGCNGPTTATQSVTVTASSTPAVSIAANTGTTACIGIGVTFTATPTNGGAAPTYQWKVNGVDVGTNATYSSATLANNDQVSVVMTSNATCISSSTGSGQVTMTINQPNLTSINTSVSPGAMANGDLLWNGTTNTGWATISNWYQLSNGNFTLATAVPAATTRVFIVTDAIAQKCVSATNNATISSAALAYDLTIGTGAKLIVSGPRVLSIFGNWISKGTFTPATGTVGFRGPGNKTIYGYGNKFYNVTLNRTNATDKTTISDAFEATNKLTVTKGILETPANITGKAKTVEVQTGAELRILSNGIFKANP